MDKVEEFQKWILTKPNLKFEQAKAFITENKDTIRNLLVKGYSVKTLHAFLTDKKKIMISYTSFLNIIRKMLTIFLGF